MRHVTCQCCGAKVPVKNPRRAYDNVKSVTVDGIKFRSGWEARVASHLTNLGFEWEYETRRFEFPKHLRGARSYLSDFYLPEEDLFIEVKGYFSSKDKTKFKRLREYYPELRFQIICSKRNKDAIAFYSKWGAKVSFIEEIIEDH